MTIGAKRNVLLGMATGKYVAFIDDDDSVPDYYVKKVVEAVQEDDPDVLGIHGTINIMFRHGIKVKRSFYHTIDNKTYYESPRGYERPPNHLNPMKREIALRYQFPGRNMGEDTDWAMRICRDGVLKVQKWISDPMYFYEYNAFKVD